MQFPLQNRYFRAMVTSGNRINNVPYITMVTIDTIRKLIDLVIKVKRICLFAVQTKNQNKVMPIGIVVVVLFTKVGQLTSLDH